MESRIYSPYLCNKLFRIILWKAYGKDTISFLFCLMNLPHIISSVTIDWTFTIEVLAVGMDDNDDNMQIHKCDMRYTFTLEDDRVPLYATTDEISKELLKPSKIHRINIKMDMMVSGWELLE